MIRLDAPGCSLRGELVEIAAEIERLAHALDVPSEAPDAIHRIRTGAKRFRALLKLGSAPLRARERQQVRSAVRRVKDSVAAARDAHVIAARLRQFSLATGSSETLLRCRQPGTARVVALAGRLCEITGELPLERLSLADVLGAFSALYARARGEYRVCRRQPGDSAMHEWRKRVKALYYQAAALSALPPTRAVAAGAKRLGSRLGDHHDLAIVRDFLDGSRKPARRLGEKLASRKERLTQTCLAAGARLFAEDPRALAERLDVAARRAGAPA